MDLDFIGETSPSHGASSTPTTVYSDDESSYTTDLDLDDGGSYDNPFDFKTLKAVNKTLFIPAAPYPPWAKALIVLVCSVIIVGTVVGNVLVCMAVSIVRKLRTPSNWLIVSLAVSDLLVAVLVMPLAVVYEIKGKWVFNAAMCDGWTSLDVLLCTASILNLCMISVDRYLVITRPFQYAVKRTPARMAAMILSVWVASALISIPPLFGFKEDMEPGECHLSQKIGYQLYATFGAFYMPLVIMIVIYVRIFAVSKRIAKAEALSKPSNLHGNHGSFRGSSGGGGGGRAPVGQRWSSAAVDEQRRPSLQLPTVSSKNSLDVSSPTSRLNNTASRQHSVADHNNHHGGEGGLRKTRSFLHRQVHRLPSAAKDTKATKTLGVIMGAFTVCWLPFFILALIKPFCLGDCIPNELSTCFLWLGFTNSFLNPIIYARFNRDFRTPFKEILLCRCRGIDRRLRSESYVEQFGAASGHGSAAGAQHQQLRLTASASADVQRSQVRHSLCKAPSFVVSPAVDDVADCAEDAKDVDRLTGKCDGSAEDRRTETVSESPVTSAVPSTSLTVGVSVHNGIG